LSSWLLAPPNANISFSGGSNFYGQAIAKHHQRYGRHQHLLRLEPEQGRGCSSLKLGGAVTNSFNSATESPATNPPSNTTTSGGNVGSNGNIAVDGSSTNVNGTHRFGYRRRRQLQSAALRSQHARIELLELLHRRKRRGDDIARDRCQAVLPLNRLTQIAPPNRSSNGAWTNRRGKVICGTSVDPAILTSAGSRVNY